MEVCTSCPDHPLKKRVRNQGNHFGTLSCFPMPCIDLSLWPELQEGHRVLEFLVRPLREDSLPAEWICSTRRKKLPRYYHLIGLISQSPIQRFNSKSWKKSHLWPPLLFLPLQNPHLDHLDQTAGFIPEKSCELFAINHQLGAGGKEQPC